MRSFARALSLSLSPPLCRSHAQASFPPAMCRDTIAMTTRVRCAFVAAASAAADSNAVRVFRAARYCLCCCLCRSRPRRMRHILVGAAGLLVECRCRCSSNWNAALTGGSEALRSGSVACRCSTQPCQSFCIPCNAARFLGRI